VTPTSRRRGGKSFGAALHQNRNTSSRDPAPVRRAPRVLSFLNIVIRIEYRVLSRTLEQTRNEEEGNREFQ